VNESSRQQVEYAAKGRRPKRLGPYLLTARRLLAVGDDKVLRVRGGSEGHVGSAPYGVIRDLCQGV
jgi:hypothetical protein